MDDADMDRTRRTEPGTNEAPLRRDDPANIDLATTQPIDISSLITDLTVVVVDGMR